MGDEAYADCDCVAQMINDAVDKNGGEIPETFQISVSTPDGEDTTFVIDGARERDGNWFCPVRGKDGRIIVVRKKYAFFIDRDTGEEVVTFDCDCDHTETFDAYDHI